MERALYNGIISGLALDGESYFYVNPLEVVPAVCDTNGTYRRVKYRRQPWYGCACCPPNIARPWPRWASTCTTCTGIPSMSIFTMREHAPLRRAGRK